MRCREVVCVPTATTLSRRSSRFTRTPPARRLPRLPRMPTVPASHAPPTPTNQPMNPPPATPSPQGPELDALAAAVSATRGGEYPRGGSEEGHPGGPAPFFGRGAKGRAHTAREPGGSVPGHTAVQRPHHGLRHPLVGHPYGHHHRAEDGITRRGLSPEGAPAPSLTHSLAPILFCQCAIVSFHAIIDGILTASSLHSFVCSFVGWLVGWLVGWFVRSIDYLID